MNTHSSDQTTNVILQDGNTCLASWSQSFDKAPTLGESLEIPPTLQTELSGYDTKAVISRIDIKHQHLHLIQLDATCSVSRDQRPVFVLNSSRIAAINRPAIESYLRGHFKLPIIDWEASNEAQPLLRFHEPATGRKTILPELQSKIRALIPSPLAH